MCMRWNFLLSQMPSVNDLFFYNKINMKWAERHSSNSSLVKRKLNNKPPQFQPLLIHEILRIFVGFYSIEFKVFLSLHLLSKWVFYHVEMENRILLHHESIWVLNVKREMNSNEKLFLLISTIMCIKIREAHRPADTSKRKKRRSEQSNRVAFTLEMHLSVIVLEICWGVGC